MFLQQLLLAWEQQLLLVSLPALIPTQSEVLPSLEILGTPRVRQSLQPFPAQLTLPMPHIAVLVQIRALPKPISTDKLVPTLFPPEQLIWPQIRPMVLWEFILPVFTALLLLVRLLSERVALLSQVVELTSFE